MLRYGQVIGQKKNGLFKNERLVAMMARRVAAEYPITHCPKMDASVIELAEWWEITRYSNMNPTSMNEEYY